MVRGSSCQAEPESNVERRVIWMSAYDPGHLVPLGLGTLDPGFVQDPV